MLFLYSDDGLHFKHKIPHKMTCGIVFKGGHLTQVKIIKKAEHRTTTEWLWLLNRSGHLIQVTSTVFV